MQDASRFANARQQIETGEAKVAGIETMMELACEASSPTMRRWAQAYLRDRLNVAVTETDDETQSAASHLPR